jgi:hypothetical protein
MIWMKIADEDSASSIQVKDIGAWTARTIHEFWATKGEQKLRQWSF